MCQSKALLPVRHYDACYSERAGLADGTRVVLRPLGPGDGARLAVAFARLSPRTRGLRFLSGKAELSSHELRKLSDVDGEIDFALVACLEDAPDEMIASELELRRALDPAHPRECALLPANRAALCCC